MTWKLLLGVVVTGVSLMPFKTGQLSTPPQAAFLVVDLQGDGIKLSSLEAGVRFRPTSGDARPQQVSWTLAGTDDSFLAYDQTRNGKIDGAFEVVGGIFALGPLDGFAYLLACVDGYSTPAAFQKQDRAQQSADRVVDAKEAAAARLILWTDANHNAVSEEDELQSFAWAGLESIDLKATAVNRTDASGNTVVATSWAVRRMPDGTTRRIEVATVKLVAGK